MEEIKEKYIYKKNSKITLFIFLIIGLMSLVFFAIYAKDNGGWESLRYFYAIPVFCIIGLISLIFSIKYLKRNIKDLSTWILLIFSIIFILYIPAVKISQKIQNIIYHKEYIQDKINDNEAQINDIFRLNQILMQPRTVVDVQKNYLLLKSSLGRQCFDLENKTTDFYAVAYVPDVQNIANFETYVKANLINKEITASLNEAEYIKNDNRLRDSNYGIDMIEKIPTLMDKINKAKAQGIAMDNYSKHQITLDCNFENDMPINLYLNGETIKL